MIEIYGRHHPPADGSHRVIVTDNLLRVPATQPDEDLAIALLTKTGVHLHPGHFYDFAQSGHLVVSLIVQEQEFAEGVRRTLAHFC